MRIFIRKTTLINVLFVSDNIVRACVCVSCPKRGGGGRELKIKSFTTTFLYFGSLVWYGMMRMRMTVMMSIFLYGLGHDDVGYGMV